MKKRSQVESLDARALTSALPTLTNKLRELSESLSEDEKAVFSSIVNSAALHLQSMEAIKSTADIQYAKPISAAATVGVRKGLLALPKRLKLNK